jgi:pimeloyl-ACP methyl ester carboxylesterase
MRRAATVLFLFGALACGLGNPDPPGPDRIRSWDGVPIAYTSQGSGAGALLFIHGWSGDRDYWSAQIDRFADDYRVVTIDLAGHGDSGSGREQWTIQSLGRDVQAVVQELDLRSVVLVGHSMGGPVALEAARLMPDRVVGVIGVDTLQSVEFEYPAAWADQLTRWREDFDGQCREMVRAMFREGTSQTLVEEVVTDMCDAQPDVAIALLSVLPDYDFAGALAATPVPVLALNSDLWPTDAEANRRYDPDFDVRIIEGTGHFPMLERPDEFNRMLGQIIEELTAGGTI